MTKVNIMPSFDTYAEEPSQPSVTNLNDKVETAIIYCQDCFGKTEGKTANLLAHHSEKYKILAIIDNSEDGKDAGEVLGGAPNGIPVYRDLGNALAHVGPLPKHFLFGITPANGELSARDRAVMLRAIKYRMNIVTSFHETLGNDPDFIAACEKAKVKISNL